MNFLKRLLSQKTTRVAIGNLVAGIILAAGVQIDQAQAGTAIAAVIAGVANLYGISQKHE